MRSRLRAAWRGARSLPGSRRVIAAIDRLWWARTIRSADVVDLEYVAAVVGRRVSARTATRMYVRGGFRTGLSLNPLLHEATVSRQLSDSTRVPALYAYLVNDRSRIQVGPNWDALAVAIAEPSSADDPAGPLGHVWRSARRTGRVRLGRGDAVIEVPWSVALGRAVAAAEQARSGAAAAISGDGPPTAVTVVVAVTATGAADALSDAADLAGTDDVILTLDESRADDWTQAALMPLWRPSVDARLGEGSFTAAWRSVHTGTVVTRGPEAEISATDLRRLARAGAERPSAPLWLAPDGTLASAGIIRNEHGVGHLLAGHPPEDARSLGAEITVSALAGSTFARPASGAGAPRTLTTLSVLAPRDTPSPAADVGVTVPVDTETLPSPPGLVFAPVPGDPVRVVRRASSDEDSAPRLRWALKTAAPAGRAGEAWGDTHFARGIADALRRAGQDVAIDAYPAARRTTGTFDDVTLVLRGPHRIRPLAGGVSVLWVISHPDEITKEELDDFDLVFAASSLWADMATRRFGREVRPLLQCTDARRFRPEGLPRTDEIVFVGTARGIARPSVVEPIRAGIPVKVYGPDWTGYIPARNIAATGLPHAELPARYESAGVVLNDHWPAMQREGFISNRPYDVVAAGGRVISDDVPGIHEVFGGAVATYGTPAELITMLSGDVDALFPDPATMARIAERIRSEDSFDARAAELLRAALDLRAHRR